MAIVAQAQPIEVKRIYTTQAEGVDRQKLKAMLEDLNRQGRLTERDERLLEYLQEVNVLSLDQVQRLLWPEAKLVTAYQRLRFLLNHYLLNAARVPRAGMTAWGLLVSKVYALGPAGHLWLKEEVSSGHVTRHLKRDQVLHDLLVAELCVRLTEATLRRGRPGAWLGPGSERPVFIPGRGKDQRWRRMDWGWCGSNGAARLRRCPSLSRWTPAGKRMAGPVRIGAGKSLGMIAFMPVNGNSTRS